MGGVAPAHQTCVMFCFNVLMEGLGVQKFLYFIKFFDLFQLMEGQAYVLCFVILKEKIGMCLMN